MPLISFSCCAALAGTSGARLTRCRRGRPCFIPNPGESFRRCTQCGGPARRLTDALCQGQEAPSCCRLGALPRAARVLAYLASRRAPPPPPAAAPHAREAGGERLPVFWKPRRTRPHPGPAPAAREACVPPPEVTRLGECSSCPCVSCSYGHRAACL